MQSKVPLGWGLDGRYLLIADDCLQVRRGVLGAASRGDASRATFASVASGDKVAVPAETIPTQPHLASHLTRCLNSPSGPMLQVPMSRLEPDEDLRQRYAAMEDRLSVSVQQSSFHQIYCVRFGYLWVTDFHFFLQIVRKRLNRPMTLAEKVSCTLCCNVCWLLQLSGHL